MSDEIESIRSKSGREAAIEQWAAMLERQRASRPAAAAPVAVDSQSLREVSDGLSIRADLLSARAQEADQAASTERARGTSLQTEAASESREANQAKVAAQAAEIQARAAEEQKVWQEQQAESQRRAAELAQVQADRKEAEAALYKSQAQTLLLNGGTGEDLDQGAFLLNLADSTRRETASLRETAKADEAGRQSALEQAHGSESQGRELRTRSQTDSERATTLEASSAHKREQGEAALALGDEKAARAQTLHEEATQAGKEAEVTAQLAEFTKDGFLIIR